MEQYNHTSAAQYDIGPNAVTGLGIAVLGAIAVMIVDKVGMLILADGDGEYERNLSINLYKKQLSVKTKYTPRDKVKAEQASKELEIVSKALSEKLNS